MQQRLPSQLSAETNLADILSSDFYPPNPWNYALLLFKLPSLWYLCFSRSRKLIYPAPAPTSRFLILHALFKIFPTSFLWPFLSQDHLYFSPLLWCTGRSNMWSACSLKQPRPQQIFGEDKILFRQRLYWSLCFWVSSTSGITRANRSALFLNFDSMKCI